MITKQDILKAVRSIHKSSANKTEHRLIHPQRDWTMGVIVSLIVVLLGGVYNYQLYSRYNSIDDQITPNAERIPTYREEIVSDVVSAYETRQAAYDSYRRSSVAAAPQASSTETVATSTATTTEAVADEDREAVPADSTTSTAGQ